MARPIQIFASVALIFACGAAAASAQDDEIKLSPARIGDLWHAHWPRYAARYIALDDGTFVPCLHYNRRYPSSRHVSTEKVKDSTRRTKTKRTKIGTMELKRRVATRTTDADAKAFARALPAMKVGEYGYIRGCTVTEVLDPRTMLVEDIVLIDPEDVPGADRREKTPRKYQKRAELLKLQRSREFRKPLKLLGFDARGLEPEDYWTGDDRTQQREGVQIAIVRKEDLARSRKKPRRRARRSRKQILVAVPAERFRLEKLSETQFRDMLALHGFDEEQFVRLVLEQHRKRADDAEAWVMRIIAQAKPQPAPHDEDETPEDADDGDHQAETKGENGHEEEHKEEDHDEAAH